MFQQLVNFSFDLYDLDSGITLEMSTDHLTIRLENDKAILLWFDGGKIYPEVCHDLEHSKKIPLETVDEILGVVKKYQEVED